MARKKKHKSQSDKTDATAPATSAAVPGAAGPASTRAASDKGGAGSALERAFQVGNFSAVRRLAAQSPGAEAERLLALVKVDRATLLIGLGALAFLVMVAFLVLRAG